jgi:hypothetical protein
MQPTPQAITEMLATIARHQAEVKSWATYTIQHMMCEEAARQNLTYGPTRRNVQSFADIRSSFKENSSIENLKKIWECAFGTFDRIPRWAKSLSDTYMSLHRWEYTLEKVKTNKRTFCVEQQISLCKVEMVKALNKAVCGIGGHGKKVRICRYKEEITHENKYQKRPKAVFDVKYIASHVSTILIISLLVDRCTNNYHPHPQIYT